MRVAAADPETARADGHPADARRRRRVGGRGCLAAIAGAFFTSFPAAGRRARRPTCSRSARSPPRSSAGWTRSSGAVVGGLIIGVAITLTAGYQDEISFLGRGLSEVVPYIVMVLVLLWRPSGLFGTRELTRV